MHVGLIVTRLTESGGLGLAVTRLASAVEEAGHTATVLFGTGTAPPGGHASVLTVPAIALPPDTSSDRFDDLRRAIEAHRFDVLVVASSTPGVVEACSDLAPTMYRAAELWGVCPDGVKYWSRVGRACQVRAGWTCLPLRPLLGCGGRSTMFRLRPLRTYSRLQKLLRERSIGVLTLSSDGERRFRELGIPGERIAVHPDLVMNETPANLAEQARRVPPELRSGTIFLGRLSKEKGAHLLPAIRRQIGDRGLFFVFGEGYLRQRLARQLGDSLRAPLSQAEVAGMLLWSRSIVFPALWPEPGGIVGIDAQLFGVPLAAFRFGGAVDWPGARFFPRGDVRGMASWVGAQPPLTASRDPEVVAARQRLYWNFVRDLGIRLFEGFVRERRWLRADSPPPTLAGLTAAGCVLA